jgi:hypothetical protein
MRHTINFSSHVRLTDTLEKDVLAASSDISQFRRN